MTDFVPHLSRNRADASRAHALQPHWFHRMATSKSDANQISPIGLSRFSNRKGTTMRIFTASAIAAALALGTPAFVQAQTQGAPPQSEAQTPPAQSNKLIQSVQIVNVKDLKPEMRSKVDDVVARTSEEDMQSLRKSIDATPEAASARKAKGLSSSQVVAINIAGGVLTLFAKTA
jgi:hypothetical protein